MNGKMYGEETEVFLIKIDQKATIVGESPVLVHVVGEVQVEVRLANSRENNLLLGHLGLVGSVQPNEGYVPTGRISLLHREGGGSFDGVPEDGYRIDLRLTVEFLSEYMVETAPDEEWQALHGGEVLVTRPSLFAGQLSGHALPVEGDDRLRTYAFEEGRLTLTQQPDENWYRAIGEVTLDLSGQLMYALAPDTQETYGTGSLRTLKLRPVSLRTTTNDPTATGWSMPTQSTEARTVWGACCINLDFLSVHPLVDTTVKNSGSVDTVLNSYTDPDPQVVTVFFVDNNLINNTLFREDGGGKYQVGALVANPGHAIAKIIVTDDTADTTAGGGAAAHPANPYLLAHEIGHALLGAHPDPQNDPLPPLWEGAPQTVLQPGWPNPHTFSADNCARAYCAALQTLMEVPCDGNPVG